ncbi:MAG: NfeD family protein [Akkermansiaceae bacterium]|jgi:membrane-bound serine protease (ClpP class)
MKHVIFFLLWAIGILAAEDKTVLGKSEEGSYEGKIVLIKVGEMDLSIGQSFKFWERTLKRVQDEQAKAVIFELDTPGGMAFPTKELMSLIAELEVPTASFVNPSALSAGALIAVSTDRIYMKPGSAIGSAGLVSGTGQEIDPVMRAKLESFFDAHVRWIADKKGHDKRVIQAMMFQKEEAQEFGPVTVEKGQLLALNSSDAVTVTDNGTLLAEAEIDSMDELLELEGWSKDDLVTATPSGFEQFAWWVASVSGLLITIGLFGGYLEFKTPGFGIGGIVSITAFTIFFFGNYLAGNMAGYELAAVFGLGILLILLEIFVIPGFGIAGIVGLLMVVGSLMFSMVDGVEWQRYQWSGDGSYGILDAISGPALHLGLGIFGSIILLYLIMRYLPDVPFLKRFFLPTALAAGTGIESHPEDSARVGQTGFALTDLRPAGKAEIAGGIVDVVAEGEFVSKGAPVRIIKEDGMGVVVKKIVDL